MKFLTKDDLFAKTDDGKFAMDGQIVGFVFDNKTYAAKLTISSKDVYLCHGRQELLGWRPAVPRLPLGQEPD